jgi:collagen type VII alpha
MALAGLRVGAQPATLLGDAHVSSARPAVNSGSLSNLNVGGGYTALVQFDLGTLPAGTTAAQITRATLRVYCNRADTPGVVAVQPVGAGWSESSVTYATLPVLGTVVQTAQAGSVGQFVTFDVTSTVQGWVSSSATNNGLALTAGSAVVQFDSKENDQTAHAPQLEIALAAGGAGSIGATGSTGLTGATGSAGATGAVGAMGLQGVAGAMGAVGATGSVGATGIAGAKGATGVIGLAGATGATGAAGASGVAGSTGATGATGVGLQGVAGATGATGSTGAIGGPGLAYQGMYSSAENYALGDVVLFAGSSYASLQGTNHGNTPGLSPLYWGLLTAQGPIGLTGAGGATGATGAQGFPGSVGPAGEQGIQGLQGIAGQAGAQGIPGVSGATGLQGPAGSQGVAGPTGLSFQGAYSSATNYALGDGVLWQGAGWVSLIAANHGNTPNQSPAEWAMFAAQGSAGAAGEAGVTGATGVAGANGLVGLIGATGATGAAGTAGLPGLVYQGTYSSTTNYGLGDVVLYGGASYVSLMAANHGNTPGLSASVWGILTVQGAVGVTGSVGATGPVGSQGVAGPQGMQGLQGVAGPAGVQGPAGAQGVTGVAGVQGAVGEQGLQGVAGQAGAQGVQGIIGATGAQGVAGPQGLVGSTGLNFRGVYAPGTNYALGDGVLWQGAGWVSLIAGNLGNTPDQSALAWVMFATQGGTGATGAGGAVGAQGLAGATGLQGATGSTGAVGATGLQGVAGLSFRGVYSAATSYGVGEAVSYGGSSYLSLVGGNAGQTPGQSPAYWAVLAAQGYAGATGAVGVTGPVGLAGITGATGATGAQGAPVSFAGEWVTLQSYVVGSAVSYGGASYIATAANSGREPDVSPAYWGLLVAAGSVGATGLTGATGLQGPSGYPGATGAQGSGGLQGVAGPVGVTGSVGSTGAAGPVGATGATGVAGLVYGGTYLPGTSYGVGLAVTYLGSSYVSLVANNLGQTPGLSPSSWSLLAQAGSNGLVGQTGATGAVGSTGAAGLAGATGATGVAGTNGATGAMGMSWQGVWASATNYGANAAVSYGGASYVSLVSNFGQTPGLSPASWSLLAASGTAGAVGATGATGVQGSTGVQGASGAAGVAGATGAIGAVGMNFRGAWAQATNYAVNDAVTFAGSTYLASAQGPGKEPDVSPQAWEVIAQSGGAGPTGAAGTTATVNVGTVTTLAAGVSATVSNSGTATAAVLNFGIPQGAAGTAGSSGGAAVSNNAYAATYHPASDAMTYYAVNSSASAASGPETGAVLAWVPLGCTATRLDVYSQQSNSVTVTLRTGTATSMANTTISCAPAPNGSCTALGSVAIAAGNFIDFIFSGASGTTAGVWTSLQCS